MNSVSHLVFHLLERLLALAFLILLLPMLIAVTLLLHYNTPSPIILKDQFLRCDDTLTTIYRFKTTGPGTPFFTPLGRFLRKSQIDEWPCFWSVLLGKLRIAEIPPSLRGRNGRNRD